MTITRVTRAGVWVWMFSTGCVSPGDTDEADHDLAVELDVRHGSAIRGTAQTIGITDTGVERRPIDLSGVTFGAYSHVRGALIHQTGEGHADGTFTAPIADGARSWELEADLLGKLLVDSTARHPTMNLTVLGRLDAVSPTTETDVTLAVTGLEPWTPGDTTEIAIGNNGGVVFSPEGSGPPAHATTLDSSFDWNGQAPLVEAARGDHAVVTQLTVRPSTGDSYQAVAMAGTATGFTQLDGVPSTMHVAMSSVAQRSLALRWRGPSFSAVLEEIGPHASTTFANVIVDALPDADRDGFYATAPDLLIYTPSDPGADLRLHTSYGNPYHQANGKRWDEFVSLSYGASVAVQLGSAEPELENVLLQSNRSIAMFDGVVAPRLSPARRIRLSGDTLRWDAPSLGRPNQYFVVIHNLAIVDGTTAITARIGFRTTDTEIQIPADIVPPGQSFVAIINSIDWGDVDRTVELFDDGVPFEQTPAVSQVFTR